MKKILSIILTLTMLAVPFVVQCSAAECSYDSYGNCYIEVSAEQNTNSDKKEEKGFFSKVGSFCLKTLLFATVAVGATAALCKWAPNGELGAAARDFYDNTLVPGAKSYYNYAAKRTTECCDSLKQSASDFYAGTLKPGVQTFFTTTIPDAFGYAKDWTSSVCVQPNTPCNPTHYGSDCNTTNIGDCKKTVGQLVTEGKNLLSENWNKFNDYCLINGENNTCTTTIGSVTSTTVKVFKNNYDALFQNANVSNLANVTSNGTNSSEAGSK